MFLINVPIGVVGLSVVALVLPRVAPEAARRLDLLGAVGLTAGLSLVVYGLSEAAAAARTCCSSARPCCSARLLIAGTLAYERRIAAPLLPPGLLRPPAVRGANLLAAALTASTSPAMFVAVLYVQDVLALQPGAGGLAVPGTQPDRHRRVAGRTGPDRPPGPAPGRDRRPGADRRSAACC